MLLPIECVRISIEVKSSLRTADFSQVLAQQTTFRKMRFSLTAGTREYLYTVNCAGVPQFIVAFNSKCSLQSIESWFRKEPSLIAVCVIGQHTTFVDPRSNALTTISADDSHSEVMILIGLLDTINRRVMFEISELQKQVSVKGDTGFSPDIGAYVCFDVPEEETPSSVNV